MKTQVPFLDVILSLLFVSLLLLLLLLFVAFKVGASSFWIWTAAHSSSSSCSGSKMELVVIQQHIECTLYAHHNTYDPIWILSWAAAATAAAKKMIFLPFPSFHFAISSLVYCLTLSLILFHNNNKLWCRMMPYIARIFMHRIANAFLFFSSGFFLQFPSAIWYHDDGYRTIDNEIMFLHCVIGLYIFCSSSSSYR